MSNNGYLGNDVNSLTNSPIIKSLLAGINPSQGRIALDIYAHNSKTIPSTPYTLIPSDADKRLIWSTASVGSVEFPDPSTVANLHFIVTNDSAYNLTINPTVYNLDLSTATVTILPNESKVYYSTGTEYLTVEANISLANLNAMSSKGGTFTGAIFLTNNVTTGYISLTNASLFKHTVTAATAYTLSGIPTGQNTNISFILELTNAGSHVITWWSGIKWTDGVVPILSTLGRDILLFTSTDAGITWNGFVWGKNMDNNSNKGFVAGGYNDPTIYSTIESLLFFNETVAMSSASLSLARYHLAGVNSVAKGYFGGGITDTPVADIDGINFADETAINPAAVLSVARHRAAEISSATTGYFAGGYDVNVVAVNVIDRITFSNESITVNTETLSVGKSRAAGANSTVKGYIAGGTIDGSDNTSTIDSIVFSNNSTSAVNATLSLARYHITGVNSVAKGYFAGGYPPITDIDGINFADETAINPAAVLIIAKSITAGVQMGSL